MKTTRFFVLCPILLSIIFVLNAGSVFSQIRVGKTVRQYYYTTAPVSLIHGDSLDGWKAADGGPVRGNWKVENGILSCVQGKKDDIATDKEFENFILDFEWKIAKGGNSGLKYRYADFGKIGCDINIHDTYGWLGCEYQILDDPNNPEGEFANRRTAALYHVKEPSETKVLKPAGEWNHGRIVVLNNRFEHWLNGKKVLEIDTNSLEWKERVAASKFAEAAGFGLNSRGRLMLQDHEDGIAFRNLIIREIKEQTVRIPARKRLFSGN
jgi:hypothetical protein